MSIFPTLKQVLIILALEQEALIFHKLLWNPTAELKPEKPEFLLSRAKINFYKPVNQRNEYLYHHYQEIGIKVMKYQY